MNNHNKDYSILFVDDETNALKYFLKAFSQEFSVIVSDNVAEAKNILDERSDSIAVLLSDQRMPDNNGTELLCYARENHPHIIRLLTTAYSDVNDAIAAVNNGEILRYLTKPWDINVLAAELKYAMRFFLMRHERDQLLKEKLNVKQRLIELNRVRDLITMASSITHLRNPLHAISAFLIQFPKLKQSQVADMKSLDIWGLLEDEIKQQLEISNELITETITDEGFRVGTLDELVDKVRSGFNDKTELNKVSSSVIKFNADLIENMLSGVIKTLLATCPENEKLVLSIDATSDGMKVTVSMNKFDQESSSLLTAPVGLLSAFFICYHHGGELMIDVSDGISYEITLPSEPEGKQFATLNESWVEEILQRFEEWPE